MNAFDDTLRLVESWRTYRRMFDLNPPIYGRLMRDLVLVIKSRITR